MKHKNIIIWGIIIGAFTLTGIQIMKRNTENRVTQSDYKIIFLHHSTGDVIYNGGNRTFSIFGRQIIKAEPYVSEWFKDYNQQNGTNYKITEQSFPKSEPYGWNNYPYDYYNIWVKNSGDQPYMDEPTLEILTKQYDLIIFKHCFPVSDILEDLNQPDINSSEKRIENYKLQYLALKDKLHEFPNTKFLIWTGAALVESKTTQEKALRAKAFFDWVINDWDTANDNIYIWDFFGLETEGELFLKTENASSPTDSHPGLSFTKRVTPVFCQRIVDVIKHNK